MQLHGVRVLDLTRILSGPFCTMLLADMGADVIKIEPPGGDPLRGQGVMVEGLSWYFAAFNRNKHSVVLNLHRPAGQEALRRLIATADVVVDNFRPGVMTTLGLAWPQLCALRPGIIHTSVTGFGARGPYANRPAFDFIAQAMSGFVKYSALKDGACSWLRQRQPELPERYRHQRDFDASPISDVVRGVQISVGRIAT